jgi:hypothetical protein
MSLASKRQIKPGQDVVVLRKPDDVALEGAPSSAAGGVAAGGAVVFVTAARDLSVPDVEVQPVRQMSINDTWSALSFRARG